MPFPRACRSQRDTVFRDTEAKAQMGTDGLYALLMGLHRPLTLNVQQVIALELGSTNQRKTNIDMTLQLGNEDFSCPAESE